MKTLLLISSLIALSSPVLANAAGECDPTRLVSKSANQALWDKFRSADMKQYQGNIMHLDSAKNMLLPPTAFVRLLDDKTLTISPDGKLNLRTANHEINLKLNPRDGSVVDAIAYDSNILLLTQKALLKFHPSSGQFERLPLPVFDLGLKVLSKGPNGLYSADSKGNIVKIKEDFSGVENFIWAGGDIKGLHIDERSVIVLSVDKVPDRLGTERNLNSLTVFDLTDKASYETRRAVDNKNIVMDPVSFSFENGVALIGVEGGGLVAYAMVKFKRDQGEVIGLFREPILIGLGAAKYANPIAVKTDGPFVQVVEQDKQGAVVLNSYRLRDLSNDERWWNKEKN